MNQLKYFPSSHRNFHNQSLQKKVNQDTSKDFKVRRLVVQEALQWLKDNNPACSEIIISEARLNALPINGDMHGIKVLEYTQEANQQHLKHYGPAPNQTAQDLSDSDYIQTLSSVLFPEPAVDIRQQVEDTVKEVVGLK